LWAALERAPARHAGNMIPNLGWNNYLS
jgi:hypothetical protein